MLKKFQKKGYEVRIFRSSVKNDMGNYLKNKDLSNCKAIIVAGGDGSINDVVNAMFKNNINHIPLGVIPAGTANDFAVHLKISRVRGL